MAIADYNSDADLNTSISGIDISEGCAPSGINNAIRQMMADIAAHESDLVHTSGAETVAGNKSFTGNCTAVTQASGDNSTKIATTAFVNTKAENYLPLSGGSMTGSITITDSSGSVFRHDHTNGTSLRFGVGSAGASRGIYQGPGNSHYDGWLLIWDGSGNFSLRTENNGAAGKALAGNPTGNLTWGGSAVALSDDCYLLGSTNTVTGGNLIIRDTAGSFVRISGGSAINKGANLLLYGESHTSNAGRFYIYCNDGTTTKNLNGTVGGTLQWNGQTVQTSSDERLKTAFSEVPDEILDAWGKVNWQQFKFIEDAERKGIENCRWHPGLVAQRVKAVFEAEGLDGCKYGILCHEVWDDEYDEESGELIRKAGDQWYIRYEEALAMEAIYQRRRADRLEERISGLERENAELKARLARIEEKLALLLDGDLK